MVYKWKLKYFGSYLYIMNTASNFYSFIVWYETLFTESLPCLFEIGLKRNCCCCCCSICMYHKLSGKTLVKNSCKVLQTTLIMSTSEHCFFQTSEKKNLLGSTKSLIYSIYYESQLDFRKVFLLLLIIALISLFICKPLYFELYSTLCFTWPLFLLYKTFEIKRRYSCEGTDDTRHHRVKKHRQSLSQFVTGSNTFMRKLE
jgi:hypothetical protein